MLPPIQHRYQRNLIPKLNLKDLKRQQDRRRHRERHQESQGADGRRRVTAILPPPPSLPPFVVVPLAPLPSRSSSDVRLPMPPSLPVPMNVGIRTTPMAQTINLGGIPVVINGNALLKLSLRLTSMLVPELTPTPTPTHRPPAVPLPEGGTEILRLTFDMVFNPVPGTVPRPHPTETPAQPLQQAQLQTQGPTPGQVLGAAQQPNPQAQQMQPQQPFAVPNGGTPLDFMMQNFEDQMIDDVLRETFDPSVVDGINRRAREQAQLIMDSAQAPTTVVRCRHLYLNYPLRNGWVGHYLELRASKHRLRRKPKHRRSNNHMLGSLVQALLPPTHFFRSLAEWATQLVEASELHLGRTYGTQPGAPAQPQPEATPAQPPAPSTAAPHDAPPTGAETQPQQQQPRIGLEDMLRTLQQGSTPAPGATPATTLEGVAAQTQRLLQQLNQEQQQLEAFVRALFASPSPGQQNPAPTTAGAAPAAGGPSAEEQQDFEDFFRQAAPTPAERAQQPGRTPFRFFDKRCRTDCWPEALENQSRMHWSMLRWTSELELWKSGWNLGIAKVALLGLRKLEGGR
ncbi:hypothetical protein NLJ89_g11503 [Agrocybe chaxingu]|uniref:Uncharacterized protein n=1 Tax=Agrocybe chaxingu TaxID=84603 RepID=A0A9W8MPB3_9AGAR|nr:hypothetical protein NLJ89_g11503 [Agrocybe chaxingu]